MFSDLPPSASFTHTGARDGYEVVYARADALTGGRRSGFLLEGGTAATEAGVPWSVQYRIVVDDAWRTIRARVTGVSPTGYRQLDAVVDDGRWKVNGTERPDLAGCVDIDLESSLVTNTLAVHRLDLGGPHPVDAPAAFVRFEDLRVERLEQTYRRTRHTAERSVFTYTSATFDVECELVFDASGLVLDYPGLGHRNSEP